VYVSNIESLPGEYWIDDSKGYVSVLNPEGGIETKRWVESHPSAVLHGPKGMCLSGKYIYFTDNSRLMRCTLEGGLPEVVADGFGKANDLVENGGSVWVSDILHGKVFCIAPDGSQREIHAPEGINGITFFKGKMFGVSWSLHEIYELDPTGKNAPQAFGLAGHFINLDGIEVLADGTLIISDFMGNKVSTVSPDRSSVRTLVEITSPADIGLNRAEGLLYIPHFMEDKLSVYRLRQIR
ncbi:MAG: hypothetical protein KAU94_06525, partial [Verrucomicrobia bacterium]|nr:hypothetical protein [Verrucomicrobiota bacterium]